MARDPGLGFLGSRLFRLGNARSWGSFFLGFPWILSSELSLINGLRGIKREKIFLAASALEIGAPERMPASEAMRKRGIAHRSSLTGILIFCKSLSSSAGASE